MVDGCDRVINDEEINVLLDQRLFVLSADEHEAFMQALDNPPLPNEALRKLLSS